MNNKYYFKYICANGDIGYVDYNSSTPDNLAEYTIDTSKQN
jgi:hypothetical protein